MKIIIFLPCLLIMASTQLKSQVFINIPNTNNDTDPTYRRGSVAIGKNTAATEILDVNGNIVIPFGNFIGTSGTTYKKLFQTGWDSPSGDYLSLFTAGANTFDQYEKMRITQNGNVGIGTANPKARLHIYESTALTAGSGQFMLLTSTSGNTGGNAFHHNAWLQRNTSGLGNWSDVELVDGISIDGSFANLTSTTGDNAKTWWRRQVYSNVQSWGDGNSTYMALEQGKLCIGAKRSIAHSNAMLMVDGKVVCKDLYVTSTSDWPDFVFKAGYKLPALTEIEAYYKQNGHLSLIPTEKEVAENGVNVAEMNKLLLQKIEELTILLVEQDKKMQEQGKRITQLEKR